MTSKNFPKFKNDELKRAVSSRVFPENVIKQTGIAHVKKILLIRPCEEDVASLGKIFSSEIVVHHKFHLFDEKPHKCVIYVYKFTKEIISSLKTIEDADILIVGVCDSIKQLKSKEIVDFFSVSINYQTIK